MKIRLAFMGRSYLHGRQLPAELELPDAAQLDDALARLAQRDAEGQVLPPSCLVAISGKHLGTLADHENHPLAEGDELVLIAPVAGG